MLSRKIGYEDLQIGDWIVETAVRRPVDPIPEEELVGNAGVQIVRHENSHPVILDGEPFMVRSISYPFVAGSYINQPQNLVSIDVRHISFVMPNAAYVKAYVEHRQMMFAINKASDPFIFPINERRQNGGRSRLRYLHSEDIMAKQSGKSTSNQASDIGSKGGKAGGPARANKLSAQQRSDIARKGADAKNKKK